MKLNEIERNKTIEKREKKEWEKNENAGESANCILGNNGRQNASNAKCEINNTKEIMKSNTKCVWCGVFVNASDDKNRCIASGLKEMKKKKKNHMNGQTKSSIWEKLISFSLAHTVYIHNLFAFYLFYKHHVFIRRNN